MIWGALASVLIGTVLWHLADVQMLRAFEAGQRMQGLWWVLLHIASVPPFALSSYLFFRVQRSWWMVEFPYLLMGLLISSLLFRSTLKVAITWREACAAVLIVCAMYLAASSRPPLEGEAAATVSQDPPSPQPVDRETPI